MKQVKKCLEARDTITAKLAAERTAGEKLRAEIAAAVNADSFSEDDAAKLATKRIMAERSGVVVARLENQLADAEAAIEAAGREWAVETAAEIEREGNERHAAIVKLMRVHFSDDYGANERAQGCQIKGQFDALALTLQNHHWTAATRISELEKVWENKRTHGTFLWLPPV